MMATPGNDRNLTLLLIEDDRVDQMAFTRLIRDQRPAYTVRIAGTLEEARGILEKETVDIVICDFYLGEGTPFDIIPDLQKRGIPIIIVSGAEDEDSAALAIRQGAFDFIVKDQNYNYLKVLPLAIERALEGISPAATDTVNGNGSSTGGSLPETDLPGDKEDIQLRRIVVDQSELIARYRPDGTILFVNDVYCRYFGKTRGALIGQPFEPFLPEEDRQVLRNQRAGLSFEKPAVTFEHRVHLPTGTLRWIRRTDRALFDEHRSVIEYQMVSTDITEQKQAEEALRESEARYRMLAEHAFDGILIQDLNGRTLYVNQSIVRMFGYTSLEDIIGKNTLSFVAPEFRETVKNDLKNVVEGNQGYLQKYHAVKPNGEKIIVESVGTLIPYQGRTANIVALRDVTEREMAGLQLKKELDRKKDFINVAAHELRTPLQPVVGYLNLLLDEESGYVIPPDVLEILKKIRMYVESERHMVSQILELSLLESVHEHYWPQIAPVAVRELVDLVIRQGNYDSEASITVNIPKETVVSSNGPYIHEILDELISNAVNYSNDPRIITIDKEESDKELKISVTDNGRGIAPDKLDVIFDPFYLSDADKLSRKYGRLGVGLTMARNRASHLGGTITVSSVFGIGSTFTLSLPKNGRE